MMRSFSIALTGAFQNLKTLLLAVTGAIPSSGILPDRVSQLVIVTGTATGVSLGDSNNANTDITIVLPFVVGPFDKNSIELDDYYLSAIGAGTVGVFIEVS